jgi:hypothetical protein
MALELTQHLTEMNTRNVAGVKRSWPVRKADSLTAIFETIVQKMWEPRRLTILWASTACYRVALPLFYIPHTGWLWESNPDLWICSQEL